MMKIFNKKFGLVLGFLASMLICGSVLAATTPHIPVGAINDGDSTAQASAMLGGVDLFTPSVNDKSVFFLGQLFGNVGNVLHGTSGQLFEKMFSILNIGVLTIAILFFGFNMTKWFVETGTHGQFMNQKGGGLFMFIRSIVGIGILVPKAGGGYSIIQVVVMWMVIQGIGLADKTWSTALDYIHKEGAVLSAPVDLIPDTAIKSTNDVFLTEVCMYKAHQIESKLQEEDMIASNGGTMPNGINGRLSTAANAIPKFEPRYKDGVFYFPGTPETNKTETLNPNDRTGWCGIYALQNGGKPLTKDGLNNKKLAFEALYKSLAAEAEQVADWDTSIADQDPNQVKEMEENQTKQVISDIYGAAANYTKAMGVAQTTVNNDLSKAEEKMLKDQKDAGWIMAGRYYYQLGAAQSQSVQEFKDEFSAQSKMAWQPLTKGATDLSQIQTTRGLYASNVNDAKKLADSISQGQTYTAGAIEMLNDRAASQAAKEGSNSDETAEQAFLRRGTSMMKNDPMTYLFSVLNPAGGPAIMIELSQLKVKVTDMIGGKYNHDPIIGLKELGEELLTFVSSVWLAGSIGALGLGMLAGICQASNPAASAFSLAYQWLIPLLMSVLAVLGAIGVVLYAYVPLIPFILFVFAALGWMISVVEAMVAGPLVAFGMTHPEGHDFLGKAEQAGMLLLSVFLKPTLMLMGLLGGMILSRVALQLLNHGFVYLVGDIGIMSADKTNWGGFLKLAAVIVVYAFLALAIVKQAFSMIYIIPEKVMRWIGLSPDYTQMPKEVMEGGQGMASSFGSSAGSTGQRANEASSPIVGKIGQKAGGKAREKWKGPETGANS